MMKRFALFFLLALGLTALLAYAETVELVTYYPTSSNGSFGRIHADRGTIGGTNDNPYSLNIPPTLASGTWLVAGPLGIGTGFLTAAAKPQTALQITTGQGIRVEQGPPTGGSFNGTGYELYEGANERMHLYYNTTPTKNWVELNTGATPDASLVFVNNNGQPRMFIDGATGNVGIGTGASAAAANLEVVGDISLGHNNFNGVRHVGLHGTAAKPEDIWNDNTGTAHIQFRSFDDGGRISNDMRFVTHHVGVGNTTRMVLDKDGKVGIGTTAPTQLLDVNGNVRALEVLAAGITRQVIQTHTTKRQFVTSTKKWTLIDGTEVEITTTGGKVLLLGNCDPEVNSGTGWGHITILRDGKDLSPATEGFGTFISPTSQNVSVPVMWLDSPSAGTYTYQLGMRCVQSGVEIDVAESNPAVLIAIEIRQTN